MPLTDHIARLALAKNLAGRLAKLTGAGDELLLIDRFVQGLELGLHPYGPLDLARDPRNFRHERLCERRDALVYDLCEELQLEHRARQMPQPSSGVHDQLLDEVLSEWDPRLRTRVSPASARIAKLDAAVPLDFADLDSGPYEKVEVKK